MADLCFLVQHYELAYSCYHTAKKDFLSDQAMLYAAGALVGTRLSVFPLSRPDVDYSFHMLQMIKSIQQNVNCEKLMLHKELWK